MKIKDFFRVLFTPSCWFQNYEYSEVWDKQLNELMKKEKFKYVFGYSAILGYYTIWIGNHPYASFTMKVGPYEVRPKRSTILNAMDKLQKDVATYLSEDLFK